MSFEKGKQIINWKMRFGPTGAIISHHEWSIGDAEVFNFTSNPFIIHEYGEEEWRLQLRASVESPDSFSLYLCLSGQPKKFSIQFLIEIPYGLPGYRSITKEYSGDVLEANGFPTFMSRDEFRRSMLPDNNMGKIKCKIIVDPHPSTKHDCHLAHDIASLYNDESSADITVTVCNRIFRVHKVILIARSPVFAAMFRSGLNETITNNVDISAFEVDTIEQILEFIYTDKISNWKDNGIDILAAADMYGLEKLKVMCMEKLVEDLNEKNVVKILVSAERYNLQNLKVKAMRFIYRRKDSVQSTEEFGRLKQLYPSLIEELFKTISAEK